VPPSLGNSTANAGVSLARLLWFLTPRQAVSLVASLLLERRVILVARDAETVSAAVHAANALLYPFRWQHIYLPLLPLALKVGLAAALCRACRSRLRLPATRSLSLSLSLSLARPLGLCPPPQDYLAAPMPYLAGVQADCLPLLRGLPLEEVVVIDLDTLGSVSPALGSPGDDARLLPHARELEDVFEVVREHMRSPTEFDSTPKCTELVQVRAARTRPPLCCWVSSEDVWAAPAAGASLACRAAAWHAPRQAALRRGRHARPRSRAGS
jgi:hypothetical protein